MANNVFANGQEIACISGAGDVKASFPDVCFTPPDKVPPTPPGIPIPYPVFSKAKDTDKGSKKVVISNKPIMKRDSSNFKKCKGDEAGKAAKKGMINSKLGGKVFFAAWSMNVKAEGKNIVRHMDFTTSNHASPQANSAVPMAFTDTPDPPVTFNECNEEINKIKEVCDEDGSNSCPGALNTPYKTLWGAEKSIPPTEGSIEFGMRPGKRVARSSTSIAKGEGGACVRARRCHLKPHKANPKDGKNGCCPGQTPHHIPPTSVTNKFVTHANALCICLEGTNHSIGSHGEHHHGTNFLLEQLFQVRKLVTKTGKYYSAKLKTHIGVAAEVTEIQNGCNKKCIEEQLNKQFSDNQLNTEVGHNASAMGGFSYGKLDDNGKESIVISVKKFGGA